ncbi:MAG: hypothetical protein HXN85_06235 [Prevotella pallens]|uniref:hypothetical protein n=1 Tax=Prevotella pallens TaxID=60133 RepID=UPI001CB39228|nr:hypothetical protein [Prevotella pallens]MBF1509557.1 hypothetical protein [Prevotella pallens]DAO06929.1 MAG TPA: hypothetical protein [Caudoviricetes sp.]
METRNRKKILNDIRELSLNEDIDLDNYKLSVSNYVKELEKIEADERKVNKYGFTFLLLVSLFAGVFSYITFISNEDLADNLKEKSRIIDRYEKIVPGDTVKGTTTIREITSYTDEKGRKLTVPDLMEENTHLMNELASASEKLDYIKDVYGIYIETDKNGKWFLRADRVDSALLLLPHYKDRITYDPQKKHWTIYISKIDTIRHK